MSGEKKSHKRIVFVIFPILLLAALFILPEKIREVSYFETSWYRSLEVIKQFSKDDHIVHTDTLIPFITANRIGYVDNDGTIFMNLERQEGSIICNNKWSLWNSRAEAKIIKQFNGKALEIPPNEIPFFYKNRIFSASSDALIVTEYSSDGRILWNYILPCQVSAFSVNENITVFGLVNGDILILDSKGNELSSIRVGGSRIEVILGLAVSASGNYIAAIAGIDQQRLVVIERGQKNYRVVKHKYLESNFRNQVNIYITSDENYVVYKDMKGIGVYGIAKTVDTILAVPADTFAIYEGSQALGICLVTDFIQERTVHIIKMPNIIVGKIKLPPKNTFFALYNDNMFFDDGSGLAAISFKKDK